MPDWQKLVRRRLASLALEPELRDEVLAELASHLEETYDAIRAEGVPEDDAVRRTLSQVPDWNDLQRRIRSARAKEVTMNIRVTRFWLPGLITFVVSMSFLALIEKFGPRPWALYLGDGPAVIRTTPSLMVYIPWLLLLPLIGAIGAYLSNRAGAPIRTVLVSSIFPVLPFIASFVIVLPVGLIIDRHVGVNVVAAALLRALLGWVLLPGAALLVGGLFAVLLLSRRSVSRSATAG